MLHDFARARPRMIAGFVAVAVLVGASGASSHAPTTSGPAHRQGGEMVAARPPGDDQALDVETGTTDSADDASTTGTATPDASVSEPVNASDSDESRPAGSTNAGPTAGVDAPLGEAGPLVPASNPPGSPGVSEDASGPDEHLAVVCPGLVPVVAPVPGRSSVRVTGSAVQAAGLRADWDVLDTTNASTARGTLTLTTGGAIDLTIPAAPGSFTFRLVLSTVSPEGAAGSVSCPPLLVSFVVDASSRWASGAAGTGVADGSFGAWRGAAVGIAGTWADNNQAQVGLWQLRSGGEFQSWQGDLDIAVGAIGPGETWAAAAGGAYDARWRQSLSELSRLWSGRSGQLYIRFAHEFNGDWYPWSVTSASVADFRVAWHRYRILQLEILPSAQLVFAPNSDTAGGAGFDWRLAFPGAADVDVMAVDYYNMYPWTDSTSQFAVLASSYDRFGAPRGLRRHQEFARSVGLPFAVAEWGNNATFGDSPSFIEQMHAFFAENAGNGPGQVVYEIYFNIVYDGNPWALNPQTNAPLAARAYRDNF